MSKSVLYAANTAAQTLTAGGTVNFGTAVRRYGNNVSLSAGNPVISGAGYYNVDTNFVFTAAAGTADIQLYLNGTAIPGAGAQLTTEASTIYSVSIPAVVRVYCPCAGDSTITATVSGVASVIANAAVTVEKL